MLQSTGKLGTDKLMQACFELARINKRSPRPVDTKEITKLAERYHAVSLSFLSEVLRIDVKLLIRAVTYLTQAHGAPRDGDDIAWFKDKLEAVLEVARPYAILDEDGRAFLQDIRVGLDMSYADK